MPEEKDKLNFFQITPKTKGYELRISWQRKSDDYYALTTLPEVFEEIKRALSKEK